MQDDADGNDACPFDNKRGPGDKLLKHSKTESSLTAENHSHKRKTTGQNIKVNHEHVRKSRRITKRCALDVGFSDEDAELHFLEKSNASKRAVSRHKDYQGGTAVHGIYKVAERGQIDGLKDLGTPGSIKDGKKKLNSEKKCENQDYVEEDPKSSDESISEGKKPKRGSVDLFDSFKDVLSGSDASIIDISSGLVPTLSKSEIFIYLYLFLLIDAVLVALSFLVFVWVIITGTIII